MKKGLMTIFSLSLLMSVAQPVFGEDSRDKKKTKTAETCCGMECDFKGAANRLTKAGMIIGAAWAVEYLLNEAVKTDFVKSRMPFASHTDFIVKIGTFATSMVVGACLLQHKASKKVRRLVARCLLVK